MDSERFFTETHQRRQLNDDFKGVLGVLSLGDKFRKLRISVEKYC